MRVFFVCCWMFLIWIMLLRLGICSGTSTPTPSSITSSSRRPRSLGAPASVPTASVALPVAACNSSDGLPVYLEVRIAGDVAAVNDAVNCTGGRVSVTWFGWVEPLQGIYIGEGTELVITGSQGRSNSTDGGNDGDDSGAATGASGGGTGVEEGEDGTGAAAVVSGAQLLPYVRLFEVFEGGKLVLRDVNVTDARHRDCGGAMLASQGSEIHLEGSTAIYGCSSLGLDGGAVCVTDGSLLMMSDTAQAYNNTALWGSGGAIYANESSSVVITDYASVSSNTASDLGGGVLVTGYSTLNATGYAYFANNYVNALQVALEHQGEGGAFAADDNSQISLSGHVSVYNNSAVSYGGGFKCRGDRIEPQSSAAMITMSDYVTVEGNSAVEGGGGGSVDYGCGCLMRDHVSIVSNTAEAEGGGLTGYLYSEFDIQGYVTFTGNVARKGKGGALKIVSWGTAVIQDSVSFINNTALTQGGALYVNYKSVLVLRDNVLLVNNSAANGGAIELIDENNMTAYGNVRLVGNTATNSGGALSVYNGLVNLSDVTFESNTCLSGSAGAVELLESTQVTMTRTSFVNNKALTGGAMVVSSGSNVTCHDTNFNFNSALDVAGAVSVGSQAYVYCVNCHLANNTAVTSGGAVAFDVDSVFQCRSSSSSSSSSGSTSRDNGALPLGCTFEGNSASCCPTSYLSYYKNNNSSASTSTTTATTTSSSSSTTTTTAQQQQQRQVFDCKDVSPYKAGSYCCRSTDYIAENDTCVVCPTSCDCNTLGITLQSLPLRKGFWRPTFDSISIKKCMVKEACTGLADQARKTQQSDASVAYAAAAAAGDGGDVKDDDDYDDDDSDDGGGGDKNVTTNTSAAGNATTAEGTTATAVAAAADDVTPGATKTPTTTATTTAGAVELTPVGTDVYCSEGYKGVLCAECSDSYTRSFGRTCEQCGGEKRLSVTIAMTCAAAFIILVIVAFLKDLFKPPVLILYGNDVISNGNGSKNKAAGRNKAAGVSDPTTPFTAEKRQLQLQQQRQRPVRYAILRWFNYVIICVLGVLFLCKNFVRNLKFRRLRVPIIVFQILTGFVSITGVQFPKQIRDFLAVMDILSLDFSWVLRVGCIVAPDLYDVLLISTIGPIIFIGAAVSLYHIVLQYIERACLKALPIFPRRASLQAPSLLLSPPPRFRPRGGGKALTLPSSSSSPPPPAPPLLMAAPPPRRLPNTHTPMTATIAAAVAAATAASSSSDDVDTMSTTITPSAPPLYSNNNNSLLQRQSASELQQLQYEQQPQDRQGLSPPATAPPPSSAAATTPPAAASTLGTESHHRRTSTASSSSSTASASSHLPLLSPDTMSAPAPSPSPRPPLSPLSPKPHHGLLPHRSLSPNANPNFNNSNKNTNSKNPHRLYREAEDAIGAGNSSSPPSAGSFHFNFDGQPSNFNNDTSRTSSSRRMLRTGSLLKAGSSFLQKAASFRKPVATSGASRGGGGSGSDGGDDSGGGTHRDNRCGNTPTRNRRTTDTLNTTTTVTTTTPGTATPSPLSTNDGGGGGGGGGSAAPAGGGGAAANGGSSIVLASGYAGRAYADGNSGVRGDDDGDDDDDGGGGGRSGPQRGFVSYRGNGGGVYQRSKFDDQYCDPSKYRSNDVENHWAGVSEVSRHGVSMHLPDRAGGGGGGGSGDGGGYSMDQEEGLTPVADKLYIWRIQESEAKQRVDEVRTAWAKKAKVNITTAVVVVLYLVYASISGVIFSTFACDNSFQDELHQSYLYVDYSIACDSAKHRTYEAYAALCIIIYPIGIPLIFFLMSYRWATPVRQNADRTSTATSTSASTSASTSVARMSRRASENPLPRRREVIPQYCDTMSSNNKGNKGKGSSSSNNNSNNNNNNNNSNNSNNNNNNNNNNSNAYSGFASNNNGHLGNNTGNRGNDGGGGGGGGGDDDDDGDGNTFFKRLRHRDDVINRNNKPKSHNNKASFSAEENENADDDDDNGNFNGNFNGNGNNGNGNGKDGQPPLTTKEERERNRWLTYYGRSEKWASVKVSSATGTRMSGRGPSLRLLQSQNVAKVILTADYRDDWRYWEGVEFLRRILLTGLLVFIAPGTAVQASYACVFATVFLVAGLMANPFNRSRDTQVYVSGCLIVLVSMFIALLTKVNTDPTTEEHQSEGLFAALFVSLNIALIAVAVWNTYSASRSTDFIVN